jgi:glycosyltransferase involved in cell wall biosynthesis
MGRLIDLSEVNGEKIDLVVAAKFPAYYLKHDNKVLWLLHQHRQAYDLWGTPYGDIHLTNDGESIRKTITEHDTKYISEAKAIFTISDNTTKRLKEYNNIDAITLYHPPLGYERLYCKTYGDFIFYPSRVDQIKRQRLLVEAARYVKSKVKIVIAGKAVKLEEVYLKDYIAKYNLSEKVKLVGFISEDDKIAYYATCLGVYFGAYDEDYGYITLESFFASKPIIIHEDSGGPLEFVQNNINGYVVDVDPKIVAEKIDEWYNNRKLAEDMGKRGYRSLLDKHMDWDYVIDHLLMKK